MKPANRRSKSGPNQLIVHLTLPWSTSVTSYLPLFSRLAWHVCCWEASKAVLHGWPYNHTPSLTWGRLTGHCHLVLGVVVQVVIVRIQRRLVKTAAAGGVHNQIRRALQVPSAGDGRDVLNEHPSLWKRKKNKHYESDDHYLSPSDELLLLVKAGQSVVNRKRWELKGEHSWMFGGNSSGLMSTQSLRPPPTCTADLKTGDKTNCRLRQCSKSSSSISWSDDDLHWLRMQPRTIFKS